MKLSNIRRYMTLRPYCFIIFYSINQRQRIDLSSLFNLLFHLCMYFHSYASRKNTELDSSMFVLINFLPFPYPCLILITFSIFLNQGKILFSYFLYARQGERERERERENVK